MILTIRKTQRSSFLLSSKAGGCGLNLVGANHLVLFDPDWNPANDAQAMARVWRPGQPKPVFLYRTLSTGTIEEKVFQRQVAKLSLASNIVENQTDAVPDFSKNELRELFTYKENTLSDTHDLLNCNCSKPLNKIPLHKRKAASVDELANWVHCYDLSQLKQNPVLQRAGAKSVSFVFLKEDDPNAKKTKQTLVKKENLFGSEGEKADEGEAEYSYAEEESDESEKKATKVHDESQESDMDVEQKNTKVKDKPKTRAKQNSKKEEDEEKEEKENEKEEQEENSEKQEKESQEEKPTRKRARKTEEEEEKISQPKEEGAEPVKKRARVNTKENKKGNQEDSDDDGYENESRSEDKSFHDDGDD